MLNIIDYVAWRGDLEVTQSPLCEVDLLIFAQLVHAPLELLQSNAPKRTLAEMSAQVWPAPPSKEDNSLIHSRYELWQSAMQSERFGRVTLERFESRFEPEREKQFAAAAFLLSDGSEVIAFRGTDATLVGWKEDFNMSFESPVPSQLDAVRFLSETQAERVYACGHSKGGNLALYAASMCEDAVRARLVNVYSFDSPGLDDRTLATDGYRAICPRVCAYVPESSIIGLLMGYHDELTIIDSDSVSLWQHNPYFWHVCGRQFVRAKSITRMSRFTDRTLHAFLDSCKPEERRVLVDTLFDLLNLSGATRLRDLPKGLATHGPEVLSALRALPPSTKDVMTRLMHTLAGAGGEHWKELLGGVEAEGE